MNNFTYSRRIRFADTDSAGVVYFANLLSICHEAYEEILLQLEVGCDHRVVLRDRIFQNPEFAIPIIHAEIDFFKPLFCGDLINIKCEGNLLSQKVFEISYIIEQEDIIVAKALTRHICINPKTRQTTIIPDYLQAIFSYPDLG